MSAQHGEHTPCRCSGCTRQGVAREGCAAATASGAPCGYVASARSTEAARLGMLAHHVYAHEQRVAP